MSTAMAVTLRLPGELTIYTAAETRAEWLGWLANEDATALDHPADALCRVDAASVDQVDAAGVQLLVALSHALARRQQRRLQLVDASGPLRSACAALGASALLVADAPAGGAA